MFDELDYIGEEISLQGKPTSVWIDTQADFSPASVELDKKFDVAIIGAGIVGITTAYFLVKAGKKVIILDSHKIAKDVSGHTTAKITSLHGLIYDYLIKNVGLKKARLYAMAQEEAKAIIAKIIKLEGIDCDFKRTRAYTYSMTSEGKKMIQKEKIAARKLKLPSIDNFDFDLPFYPKNVICFDNQAEFHPRKYLLSLAKKINHLGVDILEDTKVLKFNEKLQETELETEIGPIQSKKVLVATNFPIFDTGKFFTKLVPNRSYVYAVRLKGYVPEGIYYCIDEPMHSFRSVEIDGQHLFLIGGERHKAGQSDEKERYQRLENFAKKNFNIKNFEYHWSTQDNTTTDRIPFIGLMPKKKNMYLATGFGGWGMTNGTIAAKILCDQIIGKENEYSALFNPARSKPLIAIGKFVTQNTNVMQKYVKSRTIGVDQFALVTDIIPGNGAIIEFGGEKIAAYRDKNGKTSTLSSKCTHLGCTVKWNNAEKTWDCPCHGSRYSSSGEVIHSPAIKNLEKRS